MAKYIKVEEVEAVEWTGENIHEIHMFLWHKHAVQHGRGDGLLLFYSKNSEPLYIGLGDCLIKKPDGSYDVWYKEYLESEYKEVKDEV